MGFLKKKKKEQAFDLVGESKSFTLENESEKLENSKSKEILDFLQSLFDESSQFVILTAPRSIQGVSFVQAALDNDGVEVQLGIQKDNQTYLYNKIVTEAECIDVFMNYYDYGLIPDTSEYKPVEFD